MKIDKTMKKNNKRAIKKVTKIIESSPLNPFILHYYLELKESDLNINKEAVIDKINYNNKLIEKLKQEISNANICDIHKQIVKEYIEDLEYSNNTSREIVKVICLRKQEFLLRKKQKEYNKKSQKLQTVGD